MIEDATDPGDATRPDRSTAMELLIGLALSYFHAYGQPIRKLQVFRAQGFLQAAATRKLRWKL